MFVGTVKFFNETKWFGFIRNNDTDKEVFVHISKITNKMPLNQDDVVEYDVAEGRRGDEAINVSLV